MRSERIVRPVAFAAWRACSKSVYQKSRDAKSSRCPETQSSAAVSAGQRGSLAPFARTSGNAS